MPNAAIYARISKADPKFAKVSEQEADCRKLAVQLGLTVSDNSVFVDDGISATKGRKRPGFEQLVTTTARGDFDVILAKEQSRFERSPMDRERLAIASMASGTTWYTVFEGEIDPADSDDEFMSLIRSAANRNESRRNQKRVISRNERTIAAGRPIVTKRPFGYEGDGVTIRESEAAEIRWATSEVIKGATINSIFRRWQKAGVHPVISRKELKAAIEEGREPRAREWVPGTIVDLLRRPRNAGLLVHRGEIVGPGEFPAIVERDVWEACEAVLSDPRRSVTRSRELRYMLSGVAICGTCGHVMRPTTVGGRPVYRCGSTAPRGPKRHPMIMTYMLDEKVAQAVGRHFLTAVSDDDDMTGSTNRAAEIQRKLAEIREQKSKLAALALTPGFEAIFKKKAKELNNLEDVLRNELDSAARSSATTLLEVESRRELWARIDHRVSFSDAVEARADIAKRFLELPLEDQRALVRGLFRVTVGTGVGPDRADITPLKAA